MYNLWKFDLTNQKPVLVTRQVQIQYNSDWSGWQSLASDKQITVYNVAHLHTHIYTHTSTHTHLRVHIYTHTSTCTSTHTHLHTHIYACISTHTHLRAHLHTHIYVHIYTHTHLHMHRSTTLVPLYYAALLWTSAESALQLEEVTDWSCHWWVLCCPHSVHALC